MPKKKRNGFFYFMKDMLSDLQSNGNKQHTMQSIASIAHPKWQELSQEERNYYNNRAKQKKDLQDEGKMDSLGRLIKETEQETREKEEREKARIRFVKNKIKELGSLDAIKREKFYIICFNIFCLTEEGVYIPAELGLVEFTIQAGISKEYHVFIDPGELPLGYKFTSTEHSEATHRIPVSNFDQATNNYMFIYKYMKTFVGNPGQKRLPVYCMPDEIEQTEGVLEWLKMRSMDQGETDFQVYDLATLLLEFQLSASDEAVDHLGIAKKILTKNTFDFAPNICCPWHEEQDVANHCALGIVKRYCYLMADHLCEMYNVEMIPNKHLPMRDCAETSAAYNPRPFKAEESRWATSSQDPLKRNRKPGSGCTIINQGKSTWALQDERRVIQGATPGVHTEQMVDKDEKVQAPPRSERLPNFTANRAPISAANIVRGQQESVFGLDNDDDFPVLGQAQSVIGRGRGRGVWNFQNMSASLRTAPPAIGRGK